MSSLLLTLICCVGVSVWLLAGQGGGAFMTWAAYPDSAFEVLRGTLTARGFLAAPAYVHKNRSQTWMRHSVPISAHMSRSVLRNIGNAKAASLGRPAHRLRSARLSSLSLLPSCGSFNSSDFANRTPLGGMSRQCCWSLFDNINDMNSQIQSTGTAFADRFCSRCGCLPAVNGSGIHLVHKQRE